MFLNNIETFSWFVIFNLISQAISLKDLRITVPDAVAVGDSVTLSCVYDLEQAALYSVRWYLENEEFYSYVPKEKPPGRIFSIAGLQIDLRKSNENNVFLRSVKRNQSGNYQCEVSADASFHTDSRTATMLIAELPESEPILTIYGMPGIENQHAIQFGETFRAGCVSGHSYPPVNFTWIINGIRFPSTNTGVRLINGLNNNHELWSEIMVKVDQQIMKPHQQFSLIVRCETNIFTLYRGSAETELNIIRDIFLSPFDGKVSPTIDQRGGNGGINSNTIDPGDPGNSALTGSCGTKSKLFLIKFYRLLLNFILNL